MSKFVLKKPVLQAGTNPIQSPSANSAPSSTSATGSATKTFTLATPKLTLTSSFGLATSKSDSSTSEAGKSALPGSNPFVPLGKPIEEPAETAKTPEKVKEAEKVKVKEADSTEKNNEGGFVFGENLSARADNFNEAAKPEVSEVKPAEVENKGEAKKSEEGEETSAKDEAKAAGKTLEESAAEYEKAKSQKRKFEEVEVITGEENEVNVAQLTGKLHVFDTEKKSWVERGRGVLRLNDVKDGEVKASRVVMRNAGSLRVILNTPLFPGMTLENPSEKSVRFTAREDGGVKVFVLTASPKEVAVLFRAMKVRLAKVEEAEKAQEGSDNSSPKKAKPAGSD